MKKKIILSLIALISLTTAMAKQKDKTVKLRLIETSDVHGCFFPYDFINQKPIRGSLARVSTYVNRLRGEYGNNVILLDNGDILQGQPTCYYYNYVDTEATNVAAEVINYMKYDAETLGNHDVETGHAVYDKWIGEVNCPMLGANIIDLQTGKPYVEPYTVLIRDGVKIVILGLLTPAIPNWLSEDIWSGLRFDEMVSSARYWMEHIMKKEQPDVVVGLFHSGKEGGIKTDEYEEDACMRVGKEVPGFDLILFGHDHARHEETLDTSDGRQVLFLNPANNAVSIADASIELTLRKGKVVDKKIEGRIADVVNEPVDEAFMEHFQPHIKKVESFVNRRIGKIQNTISTRECYFGSSAFNDFILNLQLQITGADISLNAPLAFDVVIPEGDILVSDMFNLYKYENQLYVMMLTGEEVRKLLEMSYGLWVNTMTSADDHLLLLSEKTINGQQRLGFKNYIFNFDSAAGIDYEVDVTKPHGEKVHILQMSNGEPFEKDKWYKVAVNSYRGNGGGELLTHGAGIPHDELGSRIVWRSDKDQRHYLMQEIEKNGMVNPQPNNNWRFVPEEWTKPAAARDRAMLFP